ncbi:MAG: hypothetical protein ABL895_10325 [Cyclobacteriaceae bacterium]
MAAQLPDILFLNSEKMDLYSNPLEPYWLMYPKKRPAFQSSESCKRGYVATWEICDKLLILRGIEGNVIRRNFLFWKKVKPYSWKMLFPKVRKEGLVASWFTGKIRAPQGNRIFYVHEAYDSRFEREMIITLEKGQVIKTVVLDNKQQKLEIGS